MTNCNPSRRECYPCNREKMLPLHREIQELPRTAQGWCARGGATLGKSHQNHFYNPKVGCLGIGGIF
jgi:hypothetical protein